ncbi:hypothetical protein [Sulfurimonas sp.]|uniref:hypothetical protein n=1 Tax=Sulfurimonas sp. TaxID=2022749 RepID=UPI002B48B634|nr:hypothetical protein [Sulfurimonas sp.]
MEITLLIKTVMGLIVLLAILMFLLFVPSTKKSKEKAQKKNTSFTSGSPVVKTESTNTSLEYLRSIIKKKKSTTAELKNALELIIKHHGIVHEKLGERAHPDFDIYMDILFTICRHPNTNKDILLTFDRSLAKLNPAYKKEINEAMTKGLTSRRV